MEKILTISIAAYNVEKYIEKCLDSLICASIDKIEILVENDGSTDKTSELVQPYVLKYPNSFFLINKDNGGYGSTINKSLEIAKGKYFRQLDGDDWIETTNLDEFVRVLESVDEECVYTPYVEVYEDINKTVLHQLDNILGKQSIEEVITNAHFLQMHSLTFKTSFLRKFGLKIEENCFYTDQEFVIYPILKVKNVYVTSLPIYMYRLGIEGQSMSFSSLTKRCEEHKKVILNLLKHMPSLQMCLPNTKQVLTRHLKRLISTQYHVYLYAQNRQKEMMEFDSTLKNDYPEMYYLFYSQASKLFKVLRLSNFRLYKLCSFYMSKKEK